MKKKYLKRTVGILAMIVVVAAYVCFMQNNITGLYNDFDYRNLRSYYLEEPGSLDVVMMGSSEIINGYLAPEAYRAEGFTSYPYAFSINSVLLWKYELAEIERTQHPETLLIETNGALYEDTKYLTARYSKDMFLDSLPLTSNKLKAAALSDEPLERLFPFIKYHYKWSDLNDPDENTMIMINRQGHAKLRGAQSQLYHNKISLDTLRPHDDVSADLNPVAEEALAEFLEICKSSDIKNIVFVEYPHVIDDDEKYERHKRAKRAEQMIREAGFDYIDLCAASGEIGLDYSTDFIDEDHMVVPGQIKTTRYLAGIVRDRYSAEPKKQSEENAKNWDESSGLIEKYYRLYDKYTSGKDPYEKVGFKLLEDRTIMKEMEELD